MNAYTDDVIDTVRAVLPKEQKYWELVGLVNKDKDIFTFGNDSKIVGRLFEIIAAPYLKEASKRLGYTLHESLTQTVYPDFYLEKENGRRIAIDVKSTYRQFYINKEVKKFNFTQGSFTSYLRNNTKNIEGTYDLYDKHYVLGFLYSRNPNASNGVYGFEDLEGLVAPYNDVEIFFMEKHRVGGDKKGSGNTDNISTIHSDSIKPFNYGAGPFSFLGNDVFEHYWKNHPRYTDSKETKQSLFNNLPTYFNWLEKQPEYVDNVAHLRERYEEYKSFIAKMNWNITTY